MNRKIHPNEYLSIWAEFSERTKTDPYAISKMSKEKGVVYETLRKIIRKGVKSPHYGFTKFFFNRDYFHKIDSEKKAYFLGLLYADGNVHRHQIRISLAEPDQYLLDEFLKEMGYKKPLVLIKKRKDFHKQKYLLELSASEMARDLIDKGCVPAKSLILKFPTPEQVPDELIPHFLRGVFDGDGSISYVKGANGIKASITSSKYFCEGFYKFINEKLNICPRLSGYKHSMAYDAKLSTRPAILFLHLIYKDASIKMERKFEKFIKLLNLQTPEGISHTRGSKINPQNICDIVNYWTDKNLKVVEFKTRKMLMQRAEKRALEFSLDQNKCRKV